jgi:hypothetical protein
MAHDEELRLKISMKQWRKMRVSVAIGGQFDDMGEGERGGVWLWTRTDLSDVVTRDAACQWKLTLSI